MLDATERTTLYALLDHVTHSRGACDVAYIIRRLHFLLTRTEPDPPATYSRPFDADAIGNR